MMAAATSTALLERRMAVLIVGRALLRVFQHLVSRTHRLEAGFGFGITGIAIRVILHRHLAIGGFDFGRVRTAGHAEQFVKIGFGSHYLENRRNP